MASQKPFLLGLLAEEFLHPGSGQSTGVIDLPVAREGHTGWPLIPDTGLKGALKEYDNKGKPRGQEEDWVKQVYGTETTDFGAGEALIGGARLLLLPIRHLEGTYAWVTCPALLERLWRDWVRLFGSDPFPKDAPDRLKPTGNSAIRTRLNGLPNGTKLHLEDLALTIESFKDDPDMKVPEDVLAVISSLLDESPAAQRLCTQFAVVTDAIFAEFSKWALPVQPHNVLDDNKLSTNLWYEETLPPDTLLYAPIASRKPTPTAAYDSFVSELEKCPYRRVGGNESVGQGWVRVTCVPAPPTQGDAT
jgi:CRISPR-associated protein Cmr4